MEKGRNITLPVCHVTGFPPAVITWYKVQDDSVKVKRVGENRQLSIINAQKQDTGLYRCKASNRLGEDSAATDLNVVELPYFTATPPSQLDGFTKKNITVQCQATGDPKPKITWTKENGELPVGRSKVNLQGTLKIWNLKEEDSGRYTCVASSKEIFRKAFFFMTLAVKKGKKGAESTLIVK